ncbi:hypothetical protein [Brevundimonas sp. A19_0]|uniref:hypothetical protein n=1 Tax=Brevundimonas sp. A19_0 TaxID=2821087 RepID=UPI001FD727B0|nr:hypothetical protein [Brevundimonas sp. A19_0]
MQVLTERDDVEAAIWTKGAHEEAQFENHIVARGGESLATHLDYVIGRKDKDREFRPIAKFQQVDQRRAGRLEHALRPDRRFTIELKVLLNGVGDIQCLNRRSYK